MSDKPARGRLFVAVWPPEEFVEKLEVLHRPEVRGVRWTTRAQWHETLCFLGSVEERVLEGVIAGLDAAVGSEWVPRPVTAVAGPRPRALGKAVWMLPVAGLEGLAGEVVREMEAREVVPPGPPAGGRRFTGHLTLARAKSPALLRDLPAPDLEASWEVQEVTLVNSTLHPDGARYDILQVWRL